jgi:hypothetical protein
LLGSATRNRLDTGPEFSSAAIASPSPASRVAHGLSSNLSILLSATYIGLTKRGSGAASAMETPKKQLTSVPFRYNLNSAIQGGLRTILCAPMSQFLHPI